MVMIVPVGRERLGGGGNAAVVSVVFQMPCGDEEHTPPGVSGVTIGTSLILFGEWGEGGGGGKRGGGREGESTRHRGCRG